MHGKHYINGTWLSGQGSAFQSINPATNELLWEGSVASLDEVDQSIDAAKKAFNEWMLLSTQQRETYIARYIEMLTAQRPELTKLIAMETGKPLWEADTEVGAMLGKFKISQQAQAERCPERSETNSGVTASLRHRPHGVIAVIGPFNFPGHLPNGHIIPALMAGNTLVFKPSELTPAVSEFMVELWDKAELPAGVLNLVQGDGSTGKALVDHPGINGVFFTGSANTGLAIQQSLIEFPHRIIALEMGGNNPLIAYDYKDIDAVVYNIIQSAYITAGQRCTCARRLILPKNQQNEKMVQRLVEVIKNIQVDQYDADPQPFMGSLVSRQAAEKVLAAQQALMGQNARALVEVVDINEKTALLRPGLIDITEISQQEDVEIFGPLLQLIWVKDFEQAITRANHTEYGLSAGLLSDNQQHYNYFLPRIRAGLVNWNRPTTGASSSAPFGGLGKSGNHRPSAYYAADYCAYPTASLESAELAVPEKLSPGLTLS